MVKKCRRLRPAEQPRELDLTSCGIKQIFASNDVGDALQPVIDHSRKVVRPVATSIAQKEIAALIRRTLFLRSQAEVVKTLHGGSELHTNAGTRCFGQSLVRARSRIAFRPNL